MVTLHAERIWLGRLERDVAIDVDEGIVTALRAGVSPEPGAHRLRGLAIPGFVNGHSHAFHRALRGRTHQGASDFWGWRDVMYSVADRLDPDTYFDLARATYAEMALAGITHVYEFHYLHHDRGGSSYADPNEMGVALARAAAAAGIRMTLLDVCYLRAGFGSQELDPVQLRFADADADDWAARVEALDVPSASTGVAIHSVRAVDRAAMAVVARFASQRTSELHVHVSEQRKENDDCMSVHRLSPTELLADAGALGPRTTAVHATHVTPMDVELLATTRTSVCMCPTTERDLGDGIGPTAAFRASGIPLLLGSDSHAVIDMLEEARCAELHERLASQRRGLTPAADLFTAATAGRSIAVGEPADLVGIATDSPRLAGGSDEDLLARVVFAATSSDVTDVIVGGRVVVSDGKHITVPDVAEALAAAIGNVLP